MIQKSEKTDLTLHFCHVQSRNPPPTLCFSCHPPAGKSLVEMEGKTGITYLKNIYVFKPSSSIKKKYLLTVRMLWLTQDTYCMFVQT